MTSKFDPVSEHLGGPTVIIEFKVDVADMNYTSEDQDQVGNLVSTCEF